MASQWTQKKLKQKKVKEIKRKRQYTNEVQSMMFTFGDVRNGNIETLELVEDIVRQHIIELTRQAALLAQKRAVRIGLEHLIFQIRRDVPKLNRVLEFLSWKDLRNSAKKASDDTTEDEPVDSDVLPPPKTKTNNKKKYMKVSWNYLQSLMDFSEDIETEDDVEMDEHNQDRLRVEDVVTKAMSREQYLEYSECRTASFTYKKNKKFREWAECAAFEIKGDDMIEVLGYLAWEAVGLITQTSLVVKKEMESAQQTQLYPPYGTTGFGVLNENDETPPLHVIRNFSTTVPVPLSFSATTPLLPAHIREAVRILHTQIFCAVEFTTPCYGSLDKSLLYL